MNLRRHLMLVVLAAAILPVIVGVLAVTQAPPKPDTGERELDFTRVSAWLVLRDVTTTTRIFKLGTELFDLTTLAKPEAVGVLRMLYKQDRDVDAVVLLDAKDQAVVEPVFLRSGQVDPQAREWHLPVDEADLGLFLKHLPIQEAREKGQAQSGVYVNQRKNVAMLAGAVSVPAGKDQRSWILGFEFSLRRLQKIVSAGPGEAGQEIFVVDGGGRLVAHRDGKRFLARESLAQHPLVSMSLQGKKSGNLRWQAEGQTMNGAFQKLDQLDWTVVTQRPQLSFRALGWQVPVWAWFAWGTLAILIAGAIWSMQTRVNRMFGQMKRLSVESAKRTQDLERFQASLLESGKLSAIGDLGAGVAHEFNNPIGGILGLTQLLLRKKKEGDKDVEFLKRIEREAKRCKSITDNLLRFSEQQDMDYREPLRLERVTNLALDLLQKKMESQRIQIEKNFNSNIPRVFGNEGQLQRAIINVLLNAETAMPDGGRLVVSTVPDGEWVVLKVQDDGKGIPSENVDRVFEPFFTTKDAWRGAGLGLSETYQIVKDHGGEVAIESEENSGTTVVFRLPPEHKTRAKEELSPVPLA